MYMLGIATFISKDDDKAVSLLRLAVDTDPDTAQIKTLASLFVDSPTSASIERDVSNEITPYSGDADEDTISKYLQETLRKYAKDKNLWTLTATVGGAVAKKPAAGNGTQVCSVLTDVFIDGRIVDGRGKDIKSIARGHAQEFADKVLAAKCDDIQGEAREALRTRMIETLVAAIDERDSGTVPERAEKMRDKIEALIEEAREGEPERTPPQPTRKAERTHDEHAAAVVRLAGQIREARDKFGDDAAKKLARSIYQRTKDDAVLTAEAIAFGKKRRARTTNKN